MSNNFKIQITSCRLSVDDSEHIRSEVRRLVKLITCPVAYYEYIQQNQEPHETIKDCFERTEAFIEERTGQRHYASYESFRVQKHRIQKAQGIGRQPTLFD